MEDYEYIPPSAEHQAQALRQQSLYNAMSALKDSTPTAEDLVAFAKRLVDYVSTGA